MRTVAIASLLLGTGCQFLFPTPIERELSIASADTSKTVRAVGAPFTAGEVMVAEVYLDDVLAGRGEIRARAQCDVEGKPALLVETSAESVGVAKLVEDVRSETRVAIELDTGLPLVSFSDLESGDKRAVYDTVFSPGKYAYRQTRYDGDKPPKVSRRTFALPIEQVPHDIHSTLGHLRNWRPKPGTAGFLYAIYGRSPWHLEVSFVGEETVETARGAVSASRIDGIATRLVGKDLKPSDKYPPRSFTMWFADDAERTPLRILVESPLAKVTIELVSRTLVKTDKETDKLACAKLPNKAELLSSAPPPSKGDDKDEAEEKIAPGIEKILRNQPR